MSGAFVAPDPAGPAVLALDLGGSLVRAAVVAADGAILARASRPTPVAEGPDAIVAACIDALAEAREAGAAAAAAAPAAIGISSAGPVDPWRGVVVDPPNLGPGFRDVPLAARASEALGLPAVLDRDTQVAAMAEGAFGAARGSGDYLYLTFSTGVGGAIVSGGRLLRGPDGTAGELGHLLVDAGGPPCGCGGRGHLEAIASGTGIVRAAREAAAGGSAPGLADLVGRHGDEFEARHVAEAEDAGDPDAAAIMERARGAVAATSVSMADVFDPDVIVAGGGLARGQGERWLEPARAAVDREAFRLPARRVRIVPAALGADVSLVGAAILTRERDLVG